MNIAFSMLSESSGANVVDRLQAYVENESQTIAQQQIADPDYWGSVGIISITGILVVFLILAILIFFFWLMGTIFKAIDNKKAEKKASAEAVKAEAAKAEPVVEQAAEAVDEEETDDEEEIVAVISAAIAAFAEEDGAAYTIKSIKKHSDTRARSAWSLAGVSDNMRQF